MLTSQSIILAVVCLILFRRPVCCRFIIRKCCPSDQHFNELLDCSHSTLPAADRSSLNLTENYGGTWPWWFPKSSVLRKKDSPHTELAVLPDNSVVLLGEGEPCCSAESAFFLSVNFSYDFFDDGSVLLYNNSLQWKDKIYPPNSFCVDRVHGDKFNASEFVDTEEYVLKLCPCKTSSCFYKCCSFGMYLDITPKDVKVSKDCQLASQDNATGECSIVDLPSKTPLNSDDLCSDVTEQHESVLDVTEWQPENLEDYFILFGFPQCAIGDESIVTELHLDQKYRFQSDGTLWLDKFGTADKLKYCTDVGGYTHQRKSTFVLRCYSRSERLFYEKLRTALYGSLAAIGAFFLLLTIITYSLVTRQLNVNDRNLIAQTWSLLIGYIAIAISQFFVNAIPHYLCVILGFVIHYAFLASFFWLNVLCIDLAWAFSELRLIRNMKVWQNRRRFLQYSIYAWLSPAIIVLVAIVIDFTPGIPDYVLKPEISSKCFFANDSMAKLAYFYGPMAVLLVTNMLLFLFTAYKIRSAQKQASTLLKNHHRQEKQRVVLYLKLFSLMGLSWIFELISWAVGGPEYYWYGTDIINLLRAVFIFITLCCKKQVLDELREKFKIPIPRGRQTASHSVVTLASNLGGEPSHTRLSNVASSSL